ncbi:ABC transporter permease subunit [Sphaerospermopsis aphanizomenoides BCCUSP55]|uniref:ABC transporter permease subunit n=1 Tax=Sphaerospermopsis aphanizomenoides TaxID=459663 RepID=UPI001904941E|nr:ABC transporter permease subunit [Sphaerospermopsis aphanizomenoides]MBK1989247.1 ABC transporter permease subunit [Sphaerospermopsis aphanizomenoides BCCUSP55]
MLINFIARVGEFNPQLFRELKGRFKPLNVILAVASSLLLQLVVFLYQLADLPNDEYSISGSYCRLWPAYQQQQNQLYQQQSQLNQQLANYQQIKLKLSDTSIIPDLQAKLKDVNDQIANLQTKLSKFCPLDQIDWQMWWRDHWEYYFLTFSVIFIFTLLIAGTYLLISDLAKEEHRGTLNFIRLSPQSETSILAGKMLGVPSLIYLFVLTAIPLHFWAGRSANIASSYILSYYAVLAACCGFFYSAALLFGLVSRWFSSFQPWLGSGGLLVLLFMTMIMANASYDQINNPLNWFRFFAPWDITNYLFPNLFHVYQGSPLNNLAFFYFPIGKNFLSLVGFYLINYGVCSYGIWQAMERCFRNPNTTILSKSQSYFFIAFTQVMFIGLAMNFAPRHQFLDVVYLTAMVNFALIISLTILLSPPRPTIQDWARYRHQNQPHESIWQDLIFGEKSPAILAIFINLVIAYIPLLVTVLAYPGDYHQDIEFGKIILTLGLSMSLMLIYATIAQLMLLMKNSKRYVWAIGTVGAAIFLPPILLSILANDPAANSAIWLFSTFPWAAIEKSTTVTIFMALLSDFTVLALLNFQLRKQVRVLGESATKALLAGR